MSIGLKIGTVAVEPHSIEWETSAQELIDKLNNILKDDIIDAQHIGSTSIKSICAKPIIDIVVGVSSFDKIMQHNEELKRNGIVYRREDHPEQHLYVCGDLDNNIQTHYIHVVIWGEKEWSNYVNLRDYLNAHEDEAKKYSDLKKQVAKEYPEDRVGYTNSKSAFIEMILCKADGWRKQLLEHR